MRSEREAIILTKASDNHPDRNEDTSLVDSENKVFIVCDGMGQSNLGPAQKASSIAANTIYKRLILIEKLNNHQKTSDQMVESFQLARRQVQSYFKTLNNPKYEDMSTTACAGVIYGKFSSKLLIGNVGDSRAYLLRDQKLTQLTLDQTMLDQQILDKEKRRALQTEYNDIDSKDQLSQNGAKYFPYFQRIFTYSGLNAVGHPRFQLELVDLDLKKDDQILFCSDGLSDNLTTKEMEEILIQKNPSIERANNLLETALQKSRAENFRSKPDDITLILAKV